MTIKNFTKHAVTVLSLETPVQYAETDRFKATPLLDPAQIADFTVRSFPSDGEALVRKEVKTMEDIDGLPTEGAVFGEISGLPDPAEGVFLIVGVMVVAAAQAAGRTTADLLTPGTTVRNPANTGMVLGTMRLQRN
jgi:hypothetical protein